LGWPELEHHTDDCYCPVQTVVIISVIQTHIKE